ncbi:MAG: aldose epimerase family protein [Bacteroidales bacterium]
MTLSGLQESAFNAEVDGKNIKLFTLTNKNGAEICITNYGGIVVSIMVPDSFGNMKDVVLGHNTIAEYLKSPEPYLGALIGRYGNRIGKCRFNIDGVNYTVESKNPDCALHGGVIGYNAVVWDATLIDNSTLELTYLSKDGESGFPGNVFVKTIYKLTDKNAMSISYEAFTDKPTVFNPTHHSFFNLNGDGEGVITNHIVTINARFFTPMDSKSVPTGEIRPVSGTPMDFRKPIEVGLRIDNNYKQLIYGRGYDHNYVLSKRYPGELAFAAKAFSPKTGISMTVETTEPGVQIYTGNWLNGFEGKKGRKYTSRTAICFETQHFPDSPNKPYFPSTILRPGEKYTQKCIYTFSIEK